MLLKKQKYVKQKVKQPPPLGSLGAFHFFHPSMPTIARCSDGGSVPSALACDPPFRSISSGAKRLFCSVPAATKAQAVWDMLQGPVSTACPASILRTHPAASLYLDAEAGRYLLAK